MENEEVHLDYLRDTNGDYILKNEVLDDSYSGDLVKHLGTYNGNLLISNRFFKKKLEHKLQDIVKQIEDQVMVNQMITMNDIISERFIAKIKQEEDFNPLFQIMNEKDIAEYTKNSKKVRIEISFEIHIKPKKHLLFNSLINSLMEFKK